MSRVPVCVFVLMVVLAVPHVEACTAHSWDENELVENQKEYSSNGRFCVVVRRYPALGDFATDRAGKVLHFDDPAPIDESGNETQSESPKRLSAALYEIGGRSRVLLREIEIDWDYADEILVSDSGRYFVVRPSAGGCWSSALAEDRLIAIYASDGSRVGALTFGDVLNAYDIFMQPSIQLELRHESDVREVLVVQVQVPKDHEEPRFEERRVDLATGALLDAKRDIFPAPRVYASPSEGGHDVLPKDCAAAATATGIAAQDLFDRAVRGPLPEFPIIAIKARIRGVVWIEVVVDERGDVVCTHSREFAFGLSQTADTAMRQWKFRPYVVNGKPVSVKGEIVFQFKDLDAEKWAEIQRTQPPD